MATPPGHRSANRYSSRDARIRHLAGRSCSHASTGHAGATAKKAGAGTTQGSNRERRAPDPLPSGAWQTAEVSRRGPRCRDESAAEAPAWSLRPATMTHAGRYTIRTLVAALLLGGLAASPAAA